MTPHLKELSLCHMHVYDDSEIEVGDRLARSLVVGEVPSGKSHYTRSR